MMSDRSIRFPHLGITFDRVGDHIDLFGFPVMYYGIVIACGMLLAGLFILREGKRQGLREEDLLDIVLWGIVCGVIGARVYYVLFSLDAYRGRWLSVFNLREGGLAIYGGFIGGVLAVVVCCKKKGLSFWRVADIAVMGGVIGQICGRWGNFFNREAFGAYTDSLFAMQLPLSSVRQPGAVTEEMRQHIVSEGGMEWIQVHPTFLYEALWNCGVFLVLYCFVRPRKRWDGQVFFSYLMLYGAGRLWIEGLRTDQLILFGTGLPVSQCLAGCFIVLAAGVLSYQRLRGR